MGISYCGCKEVSIVDMNLTLLFSHNIFWLSIIEAATIVIMKLQLIRTYFGNMIIIIIIIIIAIGMILIATMFDWKYKVHFQSSFSNILDFVFVCDIIERHNFVDDAFILEEIKRLLLLAVWLPQRLLEGDDNVRDKSSRY